MAKNKSITINGFSILIPYWKDKTEDKFVADNGVKDYFGDDEAKAKETWKLFQESQQPAPAPEVTGSSKSKAAANKTEGPAAA